MLTKSANAPATSTNTPASEIAASKLIQNAPHPPAISGDIPKSPAMNDETPKAQAINNDIPKAPATNYDTPKPPADKPSTLNLKPAITSSSLSTGTLQRTNSFQAQNNYLPNTLASLDNTGKTSTLQKQTHNLNNVFDKKVQPNSVSPVLGGESNLDGLNAYDAWSSFGPCSTSCGVGFRRRTRVCRPSTYCSGTSAETRACIKEPCVCEFI